MAFKTRKKSSIWLPCKSTDLIIGDAIVYSTIVKKGRDSETVKIKTDAGTFAVDKRVEIVGRIVGFDDSVKLGRSVLLERTFVIINNNVGDERDVILPPVVDMVLATALDERLSELARHRTEGPEDRSYSGSRYFLLDRLRAAAGGDESSKAAVQRVSECVLPLEIERAKASDVLPHAVQIGAEVATRMLAGQDLYSESVVRQLQGKVTVARSVPFRSVPADRGSRPKDPHADIPF